MRAVQARIKRASLRAEAALHGVEDLAARAVVLGGGALPPEKLAEAWTFLCLDRVHDIVTGISLRAVVEEAREASLRLHGRVDAAREAAPGRAEGGRGVVHATPFAFTRQAVLPQAADASLPGDAPLQEVAGGTSREIGPRAPCSVTSRRVDRAVPKAGAAGNRLQVFEDRP